MLHLVVYIKVTEMVVKKEKKSQIVGFGKLKKWPDPCPLIQCLKGVGVEGFRSYLTLRKAVLMECSCPLSTAEAPHWSLHRVACSQHYLISLGGKSGLVCREAEPHGFSGNRSILLRNLLSET